ncbi:MAG: ferredoxin, partial [Nitrospinae bacterium]|nr:ferredoxin [Nitrospinota bacterium]
HCKGCLRCVEICKFDALAAKVEYEMGHELIATGHTTSDKVK